jgi:hypothetical protein
MRIARRVEAGAAGGLLAGIAVAALFFVQGAISLHPFTVPASLASGLFSGGSGGPVTMSQPAAFLVLLLEVLAYTALHALAFVAIGAIAGLVVNGQTLWSSAFSGAAFSTAACTGLLYLAGWFFDAQVALDVLGLPRVLLVNAAAGVIIGTSLHLSNRSYARQAEVRP